MSLKPQTITNADPTYFPFLLIFILFSGEGTASSDCDDCGATLERTDVTAPDTALAISSTGTLSIVVHGRAQTSQSFYEQSTENTCWHTYACAVGVTSLSLAGETLSMYGFYQRGLLQFAEVIRRLPKLCESHGMFRTGRTNGHRKSIMRRLAKIMQHN